jgi:hypothetical protein
VRVNSVNNFFVTDFILISVCELLAMIQVESPKGQQFCDIVPLTSIHIFLFCFSLASPVKPDEQMQCSASIINKVGIKGHSIEIDVLLLLRIFIHGSALE